MTARFVVRTACPDDADAVETLLGASYPTLMASGYDGDCLAKALPLMIRANPALLRAGTYYLAIDSGGRPIGCGGWTFQQPGNPEAEVDLALGHIRHFATDPRWVRRGVGRVVFKHCLKTAREASVQRFECYSSLVATDFYEALGFVRIEPITVIIAPGITLPSARMTYTL